MGRAPLVVETRGTALGRAATARPSLCVATTYCVQEGALASLCCVCCPSCVQWMRCVVVGGGRRPFVLRASLWWGKRRPGVAFSRVRGGCGGERSAGLRRGGT